MRTFGNHYDLIILGSGISGSMLAVIMARKGYRVLIVDQGVHPKFAVGESTIPQTSQMISLLAREHQVPEIANLGLASPEGLRKHMALRHHLGRV
jgi:FADH2 O2-dependent halogenase